MQRLFSILMWAYWTICFHICLLIEALLFVVTWPFDRFKKAPNSVLKLLARLILKPVPTWKFDLHHADKSKIAQPVMVVANHQSFLDIPLLYLLPWNMKWVTKKSMLRIPVLGWLIRMSGHIAIDRRSLRSLRAMDALVEPIQSGIPGMIFPEGTRSCDGQIKPFKKGAFRLAQTYNFQILPVVLKGGFEAMPPGSWQFKCHARFIISVLDPVNPEAFDNAEALKNHVHAVIESEYDNLNQTTTKRG